MRKLTLVLVVMVLLVLACTLPRKVPTPTTQAPSLPTSAPTQPPQAPPTDIPNTPTPLPTQPLPPTETSQPTATQTPTAVPPTATQQPTSTSESSEYATVIFEDDFSSDKSVWPLNGDEIDDVSITNIIEGKLVVNVIKKMYDIFIPLDLSINGPVLIQVDAMLSEGDSTTAYGFICGYKDDDNTYGLAVSENGYVEIFRWENGKRATLSDASGSTAVRKGKNVLQAVCDENMIGLFANDELVVNYVSLTPLSGGVGLLAGTLDSGNIKISYDNFVLTKLNYEAQTILPTATPDQPSETESPTGVLFSDDFSSDNQVWMIEDGDLATEVISGGRLSATIHKTYYDIRIPLDMEFTGPLQIDVDGLNLEGNKNTAYGVMCGVTEEGDYYGMTVTELRHASIFRWAKDVREPLWDLYDVKAIQTSGNHITGVCNGRTLEFYVNGQLLKKYKVFTPIQGGVGLVVGSRGSNEVTLGFDNFVVTSLE